ncbi:MAG: hypothetical protein HYW78_01185 [Parcubacteria group bacterium]|nr:hypothetical protein [Parcubacteria group bacterium]
MAKIKEKQKSAQPTDETKEQQKEKAQPNVQGEVTITGGVHEPLKLNLAGKKVKDVRKALTTALNIPEGSTSLVNGKEVDGEYVLQVNDNLEFVKLAGSKGQE